MDFSVVRQMQAFCGNSPFGQVKSHPRLLSEPSQDFVNPDMHFIFKLAIKILSSRYKREQREIETETKKE